jgi:hypothetical protein
MPKRTTAKTWQRGVSFGAAGRFGAQGAGLEPSENGYLTWQQAGPVMTQIGPDCHVIGSIHLPPRHSVVERTSSWTLRTTRYHAPKQPSWPSIDLTVLGSALSPALTVASRRDRSFRWCWQVGASPQWCAYPTRRGVTVAHYSRGYPLRAVEPESAYLFAGEGRREPDRPTLGWAVPWLVTFGGGSVPVLWIFHGPRPNRIDVTSYEYLDFHFARPYGRISAMPLYGSARIDADEVAAWTAGKALPALRARGDYWTEVVRGLPDEVEEHFRVDEQAGTVEVRQTGRRLDGKRPTFCPVPPFLTAATHTSYPLTIHNRATGGPDLGTHYGPFRAMRGATLRYTMPLCPYIDTVLSPMRVTGDRRAAALTKKLRAYFDDPKHTYGGDGTYDPDSLLDILHNLRQLAWAAWALPDDQRPAAHAAIVRDLEKLFTAKNYRQYREPVTGRTHSRDPKIFDWCGDISYDMDWYSGMNLAGLALGVYFGAVPFDLVKRQWRLVCDIAAYFEIFQDWATMAPWTDMRGELLNIDCARHGAQGMIGFARLADQLGDHRQRDLARCIASRYMIFWAAEHALPGLYEQLNVSTRDWGSLTGEMTLGFGGLRERNEPPSTTHSGVRNPYTLSPLNPEHMLFLRDYGPVEKLERYEAEVLDRELPGWDTHPAKVYFGDRPAASIEHNSGAYHFYMLDPHMFLRMLALDWPSRRALGRIKEPCGPVIAAALVADAPKVLCPASVTFAGTTWDARSRTLTIRATCKKPIEARWRVLCPDRPTDVSGPDGFRTRFAGGKLDLTARCCGSIEWTLTYKETKT